MPRLSAGGHVGTIVGFEVLPAPLQTTVDARISEAIAAGLDLGRVQIGWAELEPVPGPSVEVGGQIVLDDLIERLDQQASGGRRVFVTLETIDSDGFALPTDLVDPEDPYAIADGRAFDDPLVLARFERLLTSVVPVIVAHGGFVVAVGNEPDNYLDDVGPTSSAASTYLASVGAFVAAARDVIHELAPELAVTVTVRQSSIARGFDLTPIVSQGDVASFNFYCQDLEWQVLPSTSVPGAIAGMLAAAGDLDVVIQELGCPAGYDTKPSVIAGSAVRQRDFFAAVLSAMATEPRLRAAIAFGLVDWSPDLTAQTVAPIRDAGWTELADKYEETLLTLGLLAYDTGAPRPAWQAFLDGIAALR